MKFMISLTLTWVFGFSLPLLAQDKLHGRVTDAETSRPLEAVMISVMRDGMTIDYTLTDANGRYSLPWHHAGVLRVSASLLGYACQTRDVDGSRRLDFALRPEAIVLREVEIRPGRIYSRRDTIRYNLADFATAKDTHIKDVLKRLPGIDVAENGTVSYKGKPIDHFLVEGMDVTGGRYNQVNNNLDARAVKSAELMENYQSVRALRGKLDSEEVALNLKLDEQARDQWFPTLEGGGGLTEEASGRTTALWQGSLSALQLGRGRQSIFSLKTNNTGHDLSNEQAQLATSRQSNITLPSLLTQSSISTPLDTRPCCSTRPIRPMPTACIAVATNAHCACKPTTRTTASSNSVATSRPSTRRTTPCSWKRPPTIAWSPMPCMPTWPTKTMPRRTT